MGCSACCNPLSLSPTSTAFPSSKSTLSIFRHHYTHNRLLIPLHANTHHHSLPPKPFHFSTSPSHDDQTKTASHGGGTGNGGGGYGGGGGGDDWSSNFFNFEHNPLLLLASQFNFSNEDDLFALRLSKHFVLFLAASLSYFVLSSSAALARTDDSSKNSEEVVCEIRGGRRVELVPDYVKDEFVVRDSIMSWLSRARNSKSLSSSLEDVWLKCRELALSLMLPDGFPGSVTSDYLEYSLWRGIQGVAA